MSNFKLNANYSDTYKSMTEDLRIDLENRVVAKSYLVTFVGLIISAIAAFIAPNMMNTWLASNSYNILILFFGELAIVLGASFALQSNNVVLGTILYTAYAYLTGALCGIIFWTYELASVGYIFILTASIFLVTSIYGLVTKKDLNTVGHYCFMGLWGIIISSLANIFFIHSSMLDLAIAWIGVAIFIGLIAYDSQKIKDRTALVGVIGENSIAMLGAIDLYLDFVNLFLKLLRIFGKKK